MRRLPLGLLLCALLALAFAGCGGSGKSTPTAASGPDPASIVPADSAAYAEVTVRPSDSVANGVVAAARKVSRLQDPFGELRKQLDEAIGSDGSYAKDIEPWLGDRIGGFVLLPTGVDADPDAALIVAVRDHAALQRELDKQTRSGDLRRSSTYKGVVYYLDKQDGTPVGVVGDFVVGASSLRAFRAVVDASNGSSLADSSRYQDALGSLDADRLAFAYADPQQISTQVRAMRGVPPQVLQVLDTLHLTDGPPATLSLTAHASEITLQLAGGSKLLQDAEAGDGGAELSLSDLPGDAWAAFATPPLGPIVKRVLQQAGVDGVAAGRVRQMTGLDLNADILDPLGALAGFARGTGPLDIGGGIVLRMRDAASAQKLLDRVQAIATAIGGGNVNPAPGGGFDVLVPRLPQPIVVQSKGDKIAAGYAQSSTDDLLDPKTHFDERPAGKAAIATLGEGYTPSLVVIVPPVVQLLTSLQDIDVADFSSVLPYLSAYRSLAVGTKHDGDRTTVRIVAALR